MGNSPLGRDFLTMSSNPQVICFDRIYLALRHGNLSVVFLTSGQHYVSHLTVMVVVMMMIRVIMMIMMIMMITMIMVVTMIMVIMTIMMMIMTIMTMMTTTGTMMMMA